MIWILALISLFIFLQNALAQPPVGWVKKYDFGHRDRSGDILLLPDETALVTGNRGLNSELFKIRISKHGNELQWPQIGNPNRRKPQEIIVASSGDIYEVGAVYHEQEMDGWAIHYNASGNFIYNRFNITPLNLGRLCDIQQTSYGTLLVVGGTSHAENVWDTRVRTFVAELGEDLETMRFAYGWGGNCYTSLVIGADNKFYVGGWQASGEPAMTLTCVDSAWSTEWSRQYRHPNGGAIRDVALTLEQDIVWCGAVNRNSNQLDGIVGSSDSSGNELWWQTTTDAESYGDLELLVDGAFVVAGIPPVVRKYSPAGDSIWTQWLGSGISGGGGLSYTSDDDFIDINIDREGGIWTTWFNDNDMFVARICPEDCDVLEPEIIVQGPPVWGMRFHEVHGHARELIFPKVKDATRAWATGAAAKKWTAEIREHGVWDSVIFRGSRPVNGSIDTIWFSCSPSQYDLEWVSDCKVDTLIITNSGTVSIISEKVNESGFRVRADQANVIEVVFSELPTGSTGRVSGAAASTWNATPNGDGNDGDSVIFNQLASRVDSPLHAGQSVDTFWIQVPTIDCLHRWRAGNSSSTQTCLHANIQDLTFRGENNGFRTEIRLFIEAYNEWGVERYEVYGKAWNNTLHLIQAFTPTNDSTFHQYVCSDTTGKGRYLLKVIVRQGCERLLTERELIVGVNVPTNDELPSLPTELSLAVYPNPFNGTLSISLTVPLHQEATVALYDLLGREVDIISRDEFAGSTFSYSTPPHLASGIYFIRATTGSQMQLQKVVLLK